MKCKSNLLYYKCLLFLTGGASSNWICRSFATRFKRWTASQGFIVVIRYYILDFCCELVDGKSCAQKTSFVSRESMQIDDEISRWIRCHHESQCEGRISREKFLRIRDNFLEVRPVFGLADDPYKRQKLTTVTSTFLSNVWWHPLERS